MLLINGTMKQINKLFNRKSSVILIEFTDIIANI